jgi:hypothetical protein
VRDVLQWAVAGVVVWWVWQQTARPTWLDDLLIRSYADDRVLSFGDRSPARVSAAVSAAEDACIPVGWVMRLQDMGLADAALGRASHTVVDLIAEQGPPPDTQWPTLVRYRDKVLAVTAAAYGTWLDERV